MDPLKRGTAGGTTFESSIVAALAVLTWLLWLVVARGNEFGVAGG
jgi:hypothetical protein